MTDRGTRIAGIAPWMAIMVAVCVEAAERPFRLPRYSGGQTLDLQLRGDRERFPTLIKDYLVKKHSKFDPASHAGKALVTSLAAVARGSHSQPGLFVINTFDYDNAADSFNAFQDLDTVISGLSAPVPFKEMLREHYAHLMKRCARIHWPGEKTLVAAIPPQSKMLTIKPPQTLVEYLKRTMPGFAALSGLSQKLVCDYLATFNPGIKPNGFYVVTGTAVSEASEHVRLPLGDGSVQVCLYEVNPDTPILIPPADKLKEVATPQVLDLKASWLRNLTPLKGLSPVELDISYSEIRDPAPLAGMQSLKRLNIAGLNVRDLSVLKGLKLEHLDISDNPVADLTPLAGMPLKHLRAARTLIADLKPLQKIPLITLDLEESRIRNLDGLRGMSLKQLSLEGTAIAKLAPLHGMKLKILNIDRTGVTDIEPLTEMPLEVLLLTPRRAYAGERAVAKMPTLKTVAYSPADTWRQAVQARATKVKPPKLGDDAEDIDMSLDDLDL